MKILVTGASGFLGRTLCPFLRKEGHSVVELSSKNFDFQPFLGVRFDRIYHLATWMQSGDFCNRHPGEVWLINQKINTSVLDWWQQEQPQAKLIAIGTSCAYDPAYPLEEKYYLMGRPIDSLLSFGMSKRMLLTGLQALHQQYGLNYLFLIPATLYGSAGFHSSEGKQLHFIFDLVRKIVRGKLYGEPVILWGDGQQRRELLHAQDFTKAILELSESHQNEEINVGEGCDHTIRNYAEMICDATSFPFEKIEFDTSRYVGAHSKLVSIEKLKEALPNFIPRPLQEGLKEMVDQYLIMNKKIRMVL